MTTNSVVDIDTGISMAAAALRSLSRLDSMGFYMVCNIDDLLDTLRFLRREGFKFHRERTEDGKRRLSIWRVKGYRQGNLDIEIYVDRTRTVPLGKFLVIQREPLHFEPMDIRIDWPPLRLYSRGHRYTPPTP